MRIAFIVPGSLDTRTGGYEYNRRIVSGLQARGWTVDVREETTLAEIPDGACVVVDGLALGTMADVVERESKRLKLVALVHLPLAEEVGLDESAAARLEAIERRSLQICRLVVVTGSRTVATMERYGVPRGRLAVVEPGSDRASIARGSGGPSVHLICVAALTRGKGHETLVEALARVPSDQWTLTCAGSLDRDRATVERVRTSLRGHALANHVSLAGELNSAAITDLYDRADVFVLATLHETFGMAVAEALARGLPVISTDTGAISDLVGEEAGIVVPRGDADALSEALRKVIGNASLRAQLAAGARRVRDRLPTWASAVDKMAALLETVSRDGKVTAF